MPMATACGPTVWPKPWRPSTTASTGVSVSTLDRLIGDDDPVPLPLQIARHARHAVAVVAGQIGGDEVFANALALGRRASGFGEDIPHELAECGRP